MDRPQHIGVLTSGGDAPGMNAAIRAVVRTACFNGVKISGVLDGYQGLIDGAFRTLSARDVGNILQRGGTLLRSSRCAAFRTPEGRALANMNMIKAGIDALVVIGGNGTQKGAALLNDEHDTRVIGVPSTIDNDLGGTDRTIGFDTACQTAVEAIDRLRDTAWSHGRVFFVEVMGRNAGHIAARCALACGAEYALVPERAQGIDGLVEALRNSSVQKNSSIVIVAEGDELGGAFEIARAVKDRLPSIDPRVSVLGHIQRGGTPTVADRELASLLGNAAVEGLLAGRNGELCGLLNGAVTFTGLAQAVKALRPLNDELLRVAAVLAI